MQLKKILIVRFSSIGDVILTTPVIRCLHKQLPGTEIHYVTKEAFKPVLKENPYLHKLHTFKEDVAEIYEVLAAENYDLVIDLHKNLRSLRLKRRLKTHSLAFDKINLRKLMAVNFKMIKLLPHKHIVDRYFETVAPLGVSNDGQGLDYFLNENDEVNVSSFFGGNTRPYIALVAGGSYYTKQIPLNKLEEICSLSKLPVVVLGGKEDKIVADQLQQKFPQLVNACGLYSINQSASIVRQAEWVITSDTGLMHMASAFDKKIISIWGNTISQFGMGPYLPRIENKILEVKDLPCRPCSKLGYHQCPLRHFKCMNEQDVSVIKQLIN